MITFNPFLIAYLALYLFTAVADLIIEMVNARNLERYGDEVPGSFRSIIDEQKLRKINRYTLDKTHFTYISTIVGKIVFLFIILSGLLPWLAEILKEVHFVFAGLIFFAVPALLGSVADLPFAYYHTFIIEEKYGFNTSTLKIWLSDLFKSLMIGAILGAILLSLLLIMIKYTGNAWWIWAWIIFFSFQLLMSVLYPTVIAPIFNRFTPVQDNDLVEEINKLSKDQGLKIKGIFQMDAGRRSRHTNAYFSGLGKVKRIVLYDTLLKAHEKDEILAVLAHEIGHLKKGHIKKQLLITSLASFILFYLASLMIDWKTMYSGFGFSIMSAYAGIFLVSVLWEPFGFFLSPLAAAISRRFEREADRYAFKVIKSAAPFINALKKMARDNLSNLRPHPLYVRFNYSHPPLLERIEALENIEQGSHF